MDAVKRLEFSQERLRQIAPKGQVVLSFVNRIRLDFAHTWVNHVRSLGMSNYLVGGTDDEALKGLQLAGVQCFSMKTNLPQGEWPWGSPSFKALGPHKIELIYKTLTWGFEVIITDIDALVLREPFHFMGRWPDAAFLTTSDHLGNTTADDGLETHNGIHTAFNIGYMFFRKAALPLVSEWRSVIMSKPRSLWDQGEFNRLARHQWDPRSTKGLSDPRLFWSYKKQLIGGVLPLALFAGGHNHFVSQMAQRRGVEPYSVHTTYQYAAAAGKRHRLREGGVWIDKPSYYDPPKGVLTFVPSVPADMIRPAGGMDTNGHILLINHQLKQIRSALAIAYSLGRKLVMPRVVCGYDKAWYPLSSGFKGNNFASKGVFPGAHSYILPIYNCPIDHYLEVGQMAPEETIREYSFLDNPRTPKAVRDSVASVAVRTASSGGGSGGLGGGLQLGSPEIRRIKHEYKQYRVLNLTNIGAIDALKEVLSTSERALFTAKFGFVSGSWCCAPQADQKKGQPMSSYFSLMRAGAPGGGRRRTVFG